MAYTGKNNAVDVIQLTGVPASDNAAIQSSLNARLNSTPQWSPVGLTAVAITKTGTSEIIILYEYIERS